MRNRSQLTQTPLQLKLSQVELMQMSTPPAFFHIQCTLTTANAGATYCGKSWIAEPDRRKIGSRSIIQITPAGKLLRISNQTTKALRAYPLLKLKALSDFLAGQNSEVIWTSKSPRSTRTYQSPTNPMLCLTGLGNGLERTQT